MTQGTAAILARHTPEVLAPWATLTSTVAVGTSGVWTASLREICADANGLRPLPAPPSGDADLFDRLAADPRVEVELDARGRAAVADALIWSPAHLPAQVIGDVRRLFGAAEQVEIVLDVVRNSVNQVMVARRTDAAHVESGVEFYRVGPDGIPMFDRVCLRVQAGRSPLLRYHSVTAGRVNRIAA